MKHITQQPIAHEAKVANRFVVEFPKELGIQEWTISGISNPHFVNNKWEDIRIQFIDVVGLMSPITALYKLTKMKKKWLSRKPLFTFNIKLVDPTGVEIERWEISTKSIKEVDFGSLDYNYDKFIRLSLLLEPKDCVLKVK